MAHVVKNLPAMQDSQVPGFLGGASGKELQPMQETWVVGSSLGQEGPLEKEMATHSVYLLAESHGQKSLAGYTP